MRQARSLGPLGLSTLVLLFGWLGAPPPPASALPPSANRPPVANAGPDQTVQVTDTVTLDGSGSTDADGHPLAFAWSFLALPPGSAASLSDPGAVNPTFVADEPGLYELQLVVSDGFSNSAPDTVAISTQNSPPVANAGPDQSVLVGQTATLDGSGSTDVDGDALTFAWSLTAVPPGSAAELSDPAAVMPTIVVDLPGSYVAELVVNDGQADSAPDSVRLSTANSPPVADAGPDQTVAPGSFVQLDGSGSSDVDGDPLSFRWSLTLRPPGSQAVLSDPADVAPSFTADEPGVYVAQLVVNDGAVDSSPDTVTISTENSAPVADAGPDQEVATGETVTLDGSASSDADGDPLSFEWSLLSTPPGSGALLSDPASPNPTFVADMAGSYVAQLVVNDGQVDSLPDTVTILADLPVVTLEATDDDAAEAGLDPGLFTITRSGAPDQALVVFFETAGSASEGIDYQPVGTSLTIPAGAATATLPITPIDDDEIEGSESAVVTLSVGPGYVVGVPGIASVTIADDDLPVVTIVASDPDATEAGPTNGAFTLARTGDTAAQLIVILRHGGTASDGADYVSLGGPVFAVTIPAGQATLALVIEPLPDNLVEGAETAELAIEPSLAYVIGVPDTATVTIADDPPIVNVTATDPDAAEAGLDPGVFTFTRTGGNLAAPLTVQASLGGTAGNNSDYVFISGDQTIPANQSSATKTIAPRADNRVEGAETVISTIEPDPNYLIGPSGSATVTIADDPPVITVVATDPDASETGPDPGVFTVSRSGGNLAAVLSVVVARSGTATNGADYVGIGGPNFIVAIPANQAGATVTITPIDDALVEGPETVILAIRPSPNYVIGVPDSATVTIADND
jgi:hypothetical protein